MLKITKLTEKDLIDEISELRQKVIELQSEIIRLKQPYVCPVMPNDDAPWQPYVYPYYEMSDDTTGDPLPNMSYEWRPWKYPYLPISASGTRVILGVEK